MSTQKTINTYRYRFDQETLVFDDTGEDSVIDLMQSALGWWGGFVVCRRCSELWTAAIPCQKGDRSVPDVVPCPKCRWVEGVPAVHWCASCIATCNNCGNEWKEILLNKTDILPVKLKCSRCKAWTDNLEPWFGDGR